MPPAPEPRLAAQRLPLAAGLMALALVTWHLVQQGWRLPVLCGVGALLGLTLYHAAFGFASGYRRMIVARDMRNVQAQLLMLALTTLLFAPVLAAGSAFGQSFGGAWAPLGASVMAGAFLWVRGARQAA